MVLAPIPHESYFKMVLFSFECLSSVINVLIFVHLFYQIYGKDFLMYVGIFKKSINDEYESYKLTIKTTKLFSTISVLFYMITTIFLALHHLKSSNLFFFTETTVIISDISWTIGQTSCYLLWITRLYYTFEGSIHQSSNIFFYTLACLAIIFAFSMGSAQILFIHKQHINNQHIAFIYYVTISIIVCVIDLILSSLVIYTFLSKLHDLTAHCQSNWASDYQNDIKQIKMIKAESSHFKKEKKAFNKKLKQKKRRAKKKGIVIPASKQSKPNRKTESVKTHSRILNDIVPDFSIPSTTNTQTFNMGLANIADDIISDTTCDDIDNNMNKPQFKNTNSTLISNIIATQTTMTSDTIPPDIFDDYNYNEQNNWNLSTNALQIRKSKSVWDKPKHISSPKTSSKSRMRNTRSMRQKKSKSAANKVESNFNFRLVPKLVEMERMPINGHNMNNNNYNMNHKYTDSTVKGDDINHELPYSIDSIYNPLNPELITNDKNQRNNSNATVMINKDRLSSGDMNHTSAEPSSDFPMIDIYEDMKTRDGRETDSTLTATTNTMLSQTHATQTNTDSTTHSTLNPQLLANIVRSQSVFDQYRDNLSLDDRQKLLVIVMTKYTILAVTAVISTQLFVIMGAIVTLLTYNLSHDNNILDVTNGIYYFIWSLDCIIGSLCCYLNFKMNDPMYYKLCICCNRKCRQLCATVTKNKMIEAKIDDRAQTLHQYLLNNSGKKTNVKRY